MSLLAATHEVHGHGIMIMSDAASYRNAMQEPIRHSIANAITWQLAAMEKSPRVAEDPPNADLMLGLLEKAVTWDALLDIISF